MDRGGERVRESVYGCTVFVLTCIVGIAAHRKVPWKAAAQVELRVGTVDDCGASRRSIRGKSGVVQPCACMIGIDVEAVMG